MKRLVMAGGVLGLLMLMNVSQAQEPPEMPKPVKEHALLAQFAGEWKMRAETIPAPGEEPIVCEGKETARLLGGFFLVAEGEGDMMGEPMSSILTIGYDPEKKKYVGTFVCSAGAELWQYDGQMDSSGKKLTLSTEGPSMMDPSKRMKYRESLELKDKDHKVFTSEMEVAPGKWQPIVRMTYERVK
ncbi:MAG TPA: DUF1579 domain-containing protein [Lacipirellula sp.]